MFTLVVNSFFFFFYVQQVEMATTAMGVNPWGVSPALRVTYCFNLVIFLKYVHI